jgi:hypothetical protein
LRQRVSSGAKGWSTGSPKSVNSAPSLIQNRGRRMSLSPAPRTSFHIYQRPHLTDGSDDEGHHPLSLPETAHTRGRSTSPTRSIFERRPLPTAYASLPPTPIQISRLFSPPSPVSPVKLVFEGPPSQPEPYSVPFSLWDYLREELLATDFDSHQELKWERVSNFLSMPVAMEKVRGSEFCCFRMTFPTVFVNRS